MKVQYLLLEHVHSQILMILKKNYGQGKKMCFYSYLNTYIGHKHKFTFHFFHFIARKIVSRKAITR